MRPALPLLLAVCLPVVSLMAQTKKEKSRLELLIKPSVGFNIPLTKLMDGRVTDDLLEYDDQSFHFQVLSLALCFNKRWGVEFNYQAARSNRIAGKDERFLQSMQNEYGASHYVTPPSTTYAIYKMGGLLGPVERGLLGVFYRIEKNRFFVYPKLAIGVTSFFANYGRVYLKEKGTNQATEIYYQVPKRPRDHFTAAASATLGYKLNKWLSLHCDLQTSWFRANTSFDRTVTNLDSKQSTTTSIQYRKAIYTFTPQAGVLLRFPL